LTTRLHSPARVVALALVPMLGALAGALVDERLRLGVTVWRSACRASGLALRPVVAFTFELLPCAVIGALLGGLVVLASAFASGSGAVLRARHSLGAHLGCVLAMPVGLILCALALPVPIMLAGEAVLAGLVALTVVRLLDGARAGVPGPR
jgi:hypothetical protein